MDMSESHIVAELMRKMEALETTHSAFITADDMAILTGRRTKSRQIEALRMMGVPFFVNGLGYPVVARSAIDGPAATKAEPTKKKWVPDVLRK